jgi:hypothetical protein
MINYCVLRLNDDQGNKGQSALKFGLCLALICWTGNHQVVIHRHLRISDSHIPDTCTSNAAVQQDRRILDVLYSRNQPDNCLGGGFAP